MNTQITNYIKSGKAGLYLQSYEEGRVESELRTIAKEVGFSLNVWSITEGVVNVSEDPPVSTPETQDPIPMLVEFDKLKEKSILIARDFHLLLADGNPVLIRKLKDSLLAAKMANRVFIVVGCRLCLPPELDKEMSLVEFKLPDKAQLKIVLENIAKSAGLELNGNTEPILDAASGLTTTEAEDAFALSVVEAKDIVPAIVAREKAQTVKKNGILEILEAKEKIEDIGGLEVLKEWLKKRRLAFSKKAKDYGLPIPKGVLVTGIPGVGKSLTAKAAASILGVPLLKLDGGKLFGSLVGDSERNMRTVIQTAEAIAPCVLFVDELEKAFSGSKSSGSTDGGTSARVFGTFLQWLQDKTAPCFVFATTNDVSQLPPEFLRKGRFDELWFCDLPTKDERADIWRLHIAKRGRKPDKFDIERFADKTDGFTGAEIEAAVSEALFSAFDEDTEVNDAHLLAAVGNTVPLSRTMAPQIEALRAWASGRARRASAVVAAPAAKGRKLV